MDLCKTMRFVCFFFFFIAIKGKHEIMTRKYDSALFVASAIYFDSDLLHKKFA